MTPQAKAAATRSAKRVAERQAFHERLEGAKTDAQLLAEIEGLLKEVAAKRDRLAKRGVAS
jgi:hypothetical protein